MGKFFKPRFLIFFLFLIIVSGCQKSKKSFEGTSMTMHYKVIMGEKITKNQTILVKQGIEKIFNEINNIFNNWNPNSEISKINKKATNKEILVSPQLINFLVYVDTLFELTNGRFDPTISPLKKLWISHLKQLSIPKNEEINNVKDYVGWKKIIILPKTSSIIKTHPKIELDLCGIIKGHAVDLISSLLKNLNINNFYVEWGGEIKLSGQYFSKRPWKIGLLYPRKTLSITNQSIATSGNYIQKWRVLEKSYTHIINPITYSPLEVKAELISSATVIHPSCSYADAIATALMTFSSKNEAFDWIQKNNIKAFIN